MRVFFLVFFFLLKESCAMPCITYNRLWRVNSFTNLFDVFILLRFRDDYRDVIIYVIVVAKTTKFHQIYKKNSIRVVVIVCRSWPAIVYFGKFEFIKISLRKNVSLAFLAAQYHIFRVIVLRVPSLAIMTCLAPTLRVHEGCDRIHSYWACQRRGIAAKKNIFSNL